MVAASDTVLKGFPDIKGFPGIKISSVIYPLGNCQVVKALFQSAGVKGKFRVNYKRQTGIHEARTTSVLSTTISLIPSCKQALSMHLLQSADRQLYSEQEGDT